MLPDSSAANDFWCPAGEAARPAALERVSAAMNGLEWAALSRLATGEWISDQQIARLAEIGVAEVVFGQALLTRLGRSVLGADVGL